ncbi:HNH endonuclease [Asanoa ishikariensis]
MEVLTRDGFRCRACGRSPNDHVDLELHVHHIRPWGMGGLTHPLNLITLCNTCHRGLPARNGPDHYVRAFHDLVPRNTAGPEVERGAIQYRDAVLRYRECVVRRLAE